MNRWSALAMRGSVNWEIRNHAGDLKSALFEHLTPAEAHGSGLVAYYPKYVGEAPDDLEHVFKNGPKDKQEKTGIYLVSCWCGRNVVELPRKLIGKTTLSCGIEGCEEGGVVKCKNCGQPIPMKHLRLGPGAVQSKRWCSAGCGINGRKKEKAMQQPPSEVEQYDKEIERLLGEIRQLQRGEQ